MSFKILEKSRVNSVTTRMVIEAPRVAAKALAGQFVVIRIDECGERIPLTVNDAKKEAGTLTIIFQEVGATTKRLATLSAGAALADVIGPLGRPTDFGKAGRVILVAGGVGIAEILPVARYAVAAGNEVTAIIGARTKELLILEEEMRRVVPRLTVMTDDGSHGRRGLVTVPLKELLDTGEYDLVYCVGPDIMMKVTCDVTRGYGVRTLVSLDANMIDATGMCGTCRVTVDGKVKYSCVDGPEFDGHLVDWDGFLKRQKRFAAEEKRALEEGAHQCRIAA